MNSPMYMRGEQHCEQEMSRERDPMKSIVSPPQDVRCSLIVEKKRQERKRMQPKENNKRLQ